MNVCGGLELVLIIHPFVRSCASRRRTRTSYSNPCACTSTTPHANALTHHLRKKTHLNGTVDEDTYWRSLFSSPDSPDNTFLNPSHTDCVRPTVRPATASRTTFNHKQRRQAQTDRQTAAPHATTTASRQCSNNNRQRKTNRHVSSGTCTTNASRLVVGTAFLRVVATSTTTPNETQTKLYLPSG